jgi:hypothetical protein
VRAAASAVNGTPEGTDCGDPGDDEEFGEDLFKQS